jgi:hypothetical protein
MADYEEEADNLETSQLDVISCGLGAAALLAIVFSIVKDTPPVDLSAPKFVKVVFACDQPKSQFDVIITPPPGGSPEQTIRVSDYFSPSGTPIPGSSFPIEGAGTFQIRSVAPDDQAIVNVLDGKTATHLIYSIDVYNPIAGKWGFDLLYRSQDTGEWNSSLPAGKNAPPVKMVILTQTRKEILKIVEPRVIRRIGARLETNVKNGSEKDGVDTFKRVSISIE